MKSTRRWPWRVAAILLAAAAAEAERPRRTLPVFFVEHREPRPEEAGYLLRLPGLRAWFELGGVRISWRGADIQLTFDGSEGDAAPRGAEPFQAQANILVGSDPSHWRTGLSTFGAVEYRGLYPGIDLVYHGHGGRLKSDFLVAPGASPDRIRLRYRGIERLWLDASGALVLSSPAGDLREEPPVVYQESAGSRQPVDGAYRLLSDGTVGFALGPYDPTLPLIIDPAVSYSTFLGGNGFDSATAAAVDSGGNAYIAGWTESADFPTRTPRQAQNLGGLDAFVVKLNPSGSALVYATYLGGRGDDRAFGIAVDAGGAAYVCGWTSSTNFPVAQGAQTALAGGRDAWIAKLDPTGATLVYSTFLGGASNDSANAVAVDAAGNAYLAGDTLSFNFRTANPFQPSNRGRQEAFAAKFGPAGALLYSTYLGGAGDDRGSGIAVDSGGSAHLTGATSSTNFPVAGALQGSSGGGQDAFVVKLNSAGALTYGSYLGGTGGTAAAPEAAFGIALDSGGGVYVSGTTSSANFPVANALQGAPGGGGTDGFIAKLNPSGNALVYSTFLGGRGPDYVTSLAVSPSGTAFVTGYTGSINFPTSGALQAANAGGFDAFVARLSPAGALEFGTYLGGTGADKGVAIALDGSGNATTAGQTLSYDFPLTGALQSTNGAAYGAFVVKYSYSTAPSTVSVTPSSGSGVSQIFVARYSDPDGSADIDAVDLLVGASTTPSGACGLRFSQTDGSISVARDDGTPGQAAPIGSAALLENSQCALNVAASSASPSGQNLTLTVALTFKSGFAGARNLYLQASDKGGLTTGWQQRGAWSPAAPTGNRAPSTVSLAPNSGTGLAQTFTLVFSDPDGNDDIAGVQILINDILYAINACYVRYEPSANRLVLYDDAFSASSGPLTLGSPGRVSNSQCSIDGPGSSAARSGSLVTLRLAVTFDSAFGGAKNIYALVADRQNLSPNWEQKGTWTPAPAGVNHAPGTVSITPSSGAGRNQVFTIVYADADGFRDIQFSRMLIAGRLNGAGACYLHYEPAGNRIYLHDDAATAVYGPLILGTAGNISNSQCTIRGADSSLATSGNTVTVNLSVAFTSTFTGTKNFYSLVVDRRNLTVSWEVKGVWTPVESNLPPTVQAVTPGTGSGASGVFSFGFTDPNGYQDLQFVRILTNSSFFGVNSCYLHFDTITSRLFLHSDDLTTAVGPLTPGIAGTISNRHCSIDGATSSVSGSGTQLTLNLAMSFTAAFSGPRRIYSLAVDRANADSGWQQTGSWTVP